MKDTYTDIRDTFDKLRNLNEDTIRISLNEGMEDIQFKEGDCVPYSMNDDMMKKIIEETKTQFGADYSGFKNPMLYYPKDGDIILSGKVPNLNDLLFQFRLKSDVGGCFIWVKPLTLTKDNLGVLQKIFVVCDNWRKETSAMEDIKPMTYKNGQ